MIECFGIRKYATENRRTRLLRGQGLQKFSLCMSSTSSQSASQACRTLWRFDGLVIDPHILKSSGRPCSERCILQNLKGNNNNMAYGLFRRMDYRVKDVSLAEAGKKKIDWAEAHMPVLVALRKKYEDSQPLTGTRVTGCLHVTKETGVLVRTLKAAGAQLSWCGCNPLSTQDDVAASIAKTEGVSVFAVRGVSTEQYYQDIHSAMGIRPNITIDDGADLTVEMHKAVDGLAGAVKGGTEETTTGVVRLRAMERAGKLKYPIIAVNDAETKHDFDNYYGTGQSALDGVIRATNVLICGKNLVVAGYGHVGKG